jgi:putative DNA primase/helicase
MARRARSGFTIPANKVKRKKVRWLWRKHIPWGMLSLVAGRPEKGKSLFVLRVAADVSQHYAVIISSHEDLIAETMEPRLKAAGANMKNVHFWSPRGFDLPRHVPALRAEVERLGAALVVVDPVASHTRASIYNTTAIREAMSPLWDIAESTGCAFLMVHHIIKKVDLKSDPLSAVGGAGGGIGAMVRVAYLWGESPDDPDERMLVQLKCNVAPPRVGLKLELDVEPIDDDIDAAFVQVIGTTNHSPYKIFQADPKVTAEKMEAVAEWLVAQLREGPMLKESIMLAAADAGLTRRSVSRVAEMMEVKQGKKRWSLHKEFPNV